MANIRPETIAFNFTNLSDLEDRIRMLKPPRRVPVAGKTSDHVEILTRFGKSKGCPVRARELAAKLATGYGDLLIVLLEPTDVYSPHEPEEAIQKSDALTHVDRTLRKVSRGMRNLDNTCIFDVRPFRSKSVREHEGEAIRIENDEAAYNVFEEMVDHLRPLVILACQCKTGEAESQTAAQLSSSVNCCGQLSAQRLPNGHRCLVVKSFHPSLFKRKHLQEYAEKKEMNEADVQKRKILLQNSFEFAALKAINALAGCKIVGFGEMDLQRAVSCNGPCPILRVQDGEVLCSVSYNVSRENITSPDLLRALAPSIEEHRLKWIQPVDELLCLYRTLSGATDELI